MNTLSSMMSIGRRAETRLFLIKICLENSELVSGVFFSFGIWGFFLVQNVPPVIPSFPFVAMYLTYSRLTDKLVTIYTGRYWYPVFLPMIYAQFG